MNQLAVVNDFLLVREACRLRGYMKDNRGFNECICDIFGAVPLESDKENFYDFMNTIYNAGRIAGIRSERQRRKTV